MTTTERPIRITQSVLPCKAFGPKGFTIITRDGTYIRHELSSAGNKTDLRKCMDEAAASVRARIMDEIGG